MSLGGTQPASGHVWASLTAGALFHITWILDLATRRSLGLDPLGLRVFTFSTQAHDG